MEEKQEERPSTGSTLHRLLPALPLGWIIPVLDLLRYLYAWLRPPQPEGIYEILDYDSTLEICDPEGTEAVFRRQQQVRFLQDNVLAIEDYVWGDGQIARYTCSPGAIVDQYREGDRWNIVISLRETKSKGEVADFYIERTLMDGFTKDEEWWQVELRHTTRRLKLTAIFPKERHCRRAVMARRSRHQATVLGPEHFTDLPDGRQAVTWQAQGIQRFEIFTLKWTW
jgi:hypothetical protein